jgi:hypothetical protein
MGGLRVAHFVVRLLVGEQVSSESGEGATRYNLDATSLLMEAVGYKG